MVIVHNPIQNKWFNNLNYLSKQIYVGVIWKSDVNMPFVVISTNRKAVFEDFYRSQNLKCCLISKSPVVFSSPEPKVHVNYWRPSSVNFSHFKLLLRNHWADWNQT